MRRWLPDFEATAVRFDCFGFARRTAWHRKARVDRRELRQALGGQPQVCPVRPANFRCTILQRQYLEKTGPVGWCLIWQQETGGHEGIVQFVRAAGFRPGFLADPLDRRRVKPSQVAGFGQIEPAPAGDGAGAALL